MDYIVHGILQARILEWVAYPFSSGSSPPRNQTRGSWIAGGSFTNWATREAQMANETTLNILTPGFPGGASGKESDCQWRRCRRYGFDSQVRKIPWKWKWYPTHISLPGKFYGQRSLVGHSPWGHKESNVTEHKNTYTCRSYTFLHPFVFKFLSLYEFSLFCALLQYCRGLFTPLKLMCNQECSYFMAVILNVICRHSGFTNFPKNAHLLGKLSWALSPLWVTLNSGSSFSSKLLPEIKQTICEWKMLSAISVNKRCCSHQVSPFQLPQMVGPERTQDGHGMPAIKPSVAVDTPAVVHPGLTQDGKTWGTGPRELRCTFKEWFVYLSAKFINLRCLVFFNK